MKLKVRDIQSLKRLLAKAITIGGSGDAAHPFLDEPLTATFIDIVTENNYFRNIFRVIPMANATRTVPKLLTGTEVYYQPSEATAGEETTFTATQLTMTAKKLFAWLEISEETFEDGVVDMRTMIRNLFARGMGNTEEKAFLQGDVAHSPTTTNKSLVTDSRWYYRDARLAFDGLITIGRESGTHQVVNGPATVDVFGEAIYRLGLYAKAFSDLVSFCNPWSCNQLMRDENLLTLDKYGPNATILNGEIGRIFGKWRILNSDYVTLGKAVSTHVQNVVIGDRRRVKFAEDIVVKNDSTLWAISERVAMEVEYDAAVLLMIGLQQPSAS